MSQTKLGPSLNLSENDKLESYSFWFEGFQCSLKVDRRKDGEALAITLKTAEGKVVVSMGPKQRPRFVAQLKHSKARTEGFEYASKVSKDGVKLQFEYEPATAAK